MNALATISAARACAQTLLFESLRINAFKGAIPHVLLVVDSVPCVQQKALIEGYHQILEEYNNHAENSDKLEEASSGKTFISLNHTTMAPCGSSGLFSPSNDVGGDHGESSISYSIVPFSRFSFVKDVKHLQSFFRQCGGEAVHNSTAEATSDAGVIASARWTDEQFLGSLNELAAYLQPLPAGGAHPSMDVQEAAGDEESSPLVHHILHEQAAKFSAFLRGPRAPLRELLGVILIQRNAFQNELKQYRLRLSLFDMGLRVAEHCHLECMSVEADVLAAAGRYVEALADDQVYSYARSCSLRPSIAESIGRAIADSIDGYAWRRPSWEAQRTDGKEVSDGTTKGFIPPPESLRSCIQDASVWKLLKTGSIAWRGLENGVGETEVLEGSGGVPGDESISGVGEPLRIVCKGDPQHVLIFSGGMEDCLMNTGHYPAAWEATRNDVHAHRLRFVCGTNDASPSAPPMGVQKASPESSSAAEAVGRGGMKKKDYLAMLKQKGQKPNKSPKIDSDDDEHSGITRRTGSSLATEPTGSRISASIGGTFPIGEVISESFDLSMLNGICEVFAFPDRFKHVTLSMPKPFLMTIEGGRVASVSEDAPDEFVDMLSLVRQSEGDCWVRELGIGLNPFSGLSHILSDVTSFERQWGIHLSLGKRHPLFVKQKAPRNADGSVVGDVHVKGPVLKRKEGKYHIDVFVDAAKLTMGNLEVDFTKGTVVS
ncbi:unnamed protein product [Phytomonas sp. EM1]|nr:unnamed protein product [Phytomonas sp. EM1]|eukprot:CCW64764.1 unnamed protein product [Phytomonas sp. isolate EM1]